MSNELGNGGCVSKLVYVVTMYRYGDREKHSYVLGVFSTAEMAKKWGEDDEIFRGGKYKHEITSFFIDNPSIDPKELE